MTSDRPDPAPGQASEQAPGPDPGEDTQPYRVAPPPPSSAPRPSAVRRSLAGAARGAGRGARAAGRGARAAGRGARVAGRGAGTAGQFAVTQARRAARAEGAGDSGLSRLIELHAFNAAGDAAVTISLAGTLFFSVPTGEARGQVALFLALTMLPFAIVAPLIGPFLDRFSHGRRWAIGSTMAIRGFLCWVLATAVVTESVWLFPAALGCLVASKAYGVTRAAAVPRLLPPDLTLVKANARVSLAGVVGAGVSAPLAALASTFGPEWSLRYGFVIFVLATIWAIRLPEKVDASHGEGELTLTGETEVARGSRRARTRIPAAVAFALRSNCGPRWLSGFLVMFMAFLLRENPIEGWRPEVLLGLVIGAAGLGNTLGITIGSLLRRLSPSVTVVLALLADTAVAVVAALFYGPVALALLGLTAGLSQALAKLSLDSTIQRDIPSRTQASAFARSDTTLQLAWVIGGFVGIAIPLNPQLGLGIAAAVLGAWATFVLVSRPRPQRPVPARAAAS
ncbi:MFS transporter [Nocardioides KLBMP 9356]|uniref:MFS transporter n=1 Tax=Nocardioides potassii TaxID=2911371 RepID=A0ABS9HCS4_9ACTN|nr:MFS transporter [Nocardioides potassii]MCF6378982.1 MFS transporter [Nocardioides potassii]